MKKSYLKKLVFLIISIFFVCSSMQTMNNDGPMQFTSKKIDRIRRCVQSNNIMAAMKPLEQVWDWLSVSEQTKVVTMVENNEMWNTAIEQLKKQGEISVPSEQVPEVNNRLVFQPLNDLDSAKFSNQVPVQPQQPRLIPSRPESTRNFRYWNRPVRRPFRRQRMQRREIPILVPISLCIGVGALIGWLWAKNEEYKKEKNNKKQKTELQSQNSTPRLLRRRA